jgi:hypothetical protein
MPPFFGTPATLVVRRLVIDSSASPSVLPFWITM